MDSKEYQKYTRDSGVGFLIFGSFFVLLALVILIMLLIGEMDFELSLLASCAVPLAMGVIMIWVSVSSRKDYRKHLERLEQTGEIDRVLQDFATAQPLVGGAVRLGQYYIFGKRQGGAVRYEDIRQVYQHIHKRNFVENSRSLRYVNSQGKTKDLCSLALRGKSDQDVMRIMAVIKAKNPSVHLGYR